MSSFAFRKEPEWAYDTDGMKIPPIPPNDCGGMERSVYFHFGMHPKIPLGCGSAKQRS